MSIRKNSWIRAPADFAAVRVSRQWPYRKIGELTDTNTVR